MKKTILVSLLVFCLALSACTTANQEETTVSEETTTTEVVESTEDILEDEDPEDVENDLPAPTPIVVPNQFKEWNDYYVPISDTGIADLNGKYSDKFEFFEDGLSGTFELHEYKKYTKEDVDSIKPGDKLCGLVVKRIEKLDNDYLVYIGDGEDDYVAFGLQENGFYYLMAWYEGPELESKSLGTQTLEISPDVKILDLAYPFDLGGISVQDNGLKINSVKELVDILENESLDYAPDMFLRVVDNKVEIICLQIVDNGGGHWFGDREIIGKTDKPYDDYLVTSFSFDENGLSGTFEINEFEKYNKDEIESVKVNSNFRGNKVTEATIFSTGTDKYIHINTENEGHYAFELAEDGYYYERAEVSYEAKLKGTCAFEIDPDVVIVKGSFAYLDIRGLTYYTDQEKYKSVQELVNSLAEYPADCMPYLHIRVVDNKVTTIIVLDREFNE